MFLESLFHTVLMTSVLSSSLYSGDLMLSKNKNIFLESGHKKKAN